MTQTPKIEICEQDVIDGQGDIARPFFRDVLDLDFDECLVTDESDLSDFSFSNAPEGLLEGNRPLKDLYQAWDAHILALVRQQYGIELASTRVRLVALFERIRQSQAPDTLH